jgi:hypothetical protein
MPATIFLITPPFTQLNTPYPATAYLKGFLNTKKISSQQADLGIEVILSLFTRDGLTKLFAGLEQHSALSTPHSAIRNPKSENARRIIALQDHYIHSIDAVISFLQGKNPTLAHLICQEDFLPEASRFEQLDDLEWAFGAMGTQDKAKHLATLYLEDLSDLITECVDPISASAATRSAWGRSANSFDELYEPCNRNYTYIDTLLVAKS